MHLISNTVLIKDKNLRVGLNPSGIDRESNVAVHSAHMNNLQVTPRNPLHFRLAMRSDIFRARLPCTGNFSSRPYTEKRTPRTLDLDQDISHTYLRHTIIESQKITNYGFENVIQLLQRWFGRPRDNTKQDSFFAKKTLASRIIADCQVHSPS